MRQPIGAIKSNPQTRRFLLDVMRETVTGGRARRVALPEDYAEMRFECCDTSPAEMTASMLQDLLRRNRRSYPGSAAQLRNWDRRKSLFPERGRCGYPCTLRRWPDINVITEV